MQQKWIGYSVFFMASLFYLLIVRQIDFPLTTVLKPLPIVCLMGIVAWAAVPIMQKKVLLAALFFSLLGDMALTLPIPMALETGLACFLTAHLMYIALFVSGLLNHGSRGSSKILSVVVLLFGGLLLYILTPYLGPLFLPVVIYIITIIIMSLCAFSFNALTAWGALLFLVSDTLVAFTTFIDTDFKGTIGIMLTYYLAQWFIVTGILHGFSFAVSKESKQRIPVG